ncbi:S-layer homology domain-containing protein [Paenibacillus monticola]|uniref:SLH domain-containing protein n=1 Tax=Paenibacillus monticola TaxID=2666075 RepID=A0A7X2H5D8_9BACL|nr:S-layer homology domain-containing protein [Paenibacillus monticola]MRN53028.1 hypothetical protein [Paenibacillus monticola]
MHTIFKKGMSIILVLLMIMGGISGVIVPSGGTAHAAVSFAGGTGTVSDPYQIATADQLSEVRNHLEAGLYFELTADIDLSGYTNWEPIGEIFYGNMDGNGYKITHLRINRENSDGVGLFGNFGPNNMITNMRVEDVVVRGRLYSGGLVGMNSGTISNSYATGTVNGYIYAGGLVGANSLNGTISNNSYATGSVNGKEYVGGLTGFNRGIISNSYATGSVNGDRNVGGLVGGNKKTISNSYATGSVVATSTTSSIVGGLVGENSIGTISNSYATGNVSGHFVVGGLVGYNFDGGVISTSYTTGNASGGSYVGGLVGLEDAILNSVHTSISSIAGIEDIAGVSAPVTGATPVTAITAFSVYTATVSWSSTGSVFAGGTAYTATINISPRSGYTFSGLPADFFKVAGATTTNTAGSGVVTAVFPATQVVSITTPAIAGVTAPATGDTPVSMVSDTTAYTATVSWSPTTTPFSGETAYTATITITPKAWYTLTGVPEDFFTVAGAITTNAANSGIVTAVFPPTAAIITTESITGLASPVTGAIPVTTISASSAYTATVSWSPTTTVYAGGTAYSATITMTPKAGYTFAGVPADFFKVAGATTTNGANSGVVTAVFPPTAATIATKSIAGVTAPVTGEIPESTISDTTAYTAKLTWLPTTTPFRGGTAYTATIEITPKSGYTLTGVPVDFFTVAGATTTNAANSGVVTAVFPATAATIATAEITGVIAPIAGATPVGTIADTAAYTASVTWLPTTTPFGGEIVYTATIAITPKSGYTLTGVPVDFFSIAGATTTNAANSGLVTAVFPATAAIPLAIAAIVGVTAPIAGETPVRTIADTSQYTSSIAWSPVDVTFAGEIAYTAMISITPKAGYTLTGVPENFFTVAGATTTNDADSGTVTAKFPATSAIPIATAAIAGVVAPAAGATPVSTIADTAAYTAAVNWSPTTITFAGEMAYTAMISITPKAGYTLTGVPANFFSIAGATTTNDADSGIITAKFPATAAVPIATKVIAGVTAPKAGATLVTTITYSEEYTATLAWSPTTTLFVGETAYTATITITPKVGYTLTGVAADFFVVAGATTTNAVDSGVVTVVFPATAAIPIASADITGIIAPVTGATTVSTITYSEEYTATLIWSPATILFVGETAYTVTIAITPKAGYTLTGVPANFFSVAGALTTNEMDSGVVTAVFPATVAGPITTGVIAGVTAPVTGETPVATIADTSEYTATIAWSPVDVTFAGAEIYTATLTLTPKKGYTLTGVPVDFFTVTGATATNAANSGVVTAVFPVTQPASANAGSGGAFTLPSDNIVTSTNGQLTLPVNKAGVVSFEDAVKVSIPLGATDKELRLRVDKVLDTQNLLTNNEILLSPVFEILKNFSENFSKPITLYFTFDPSQVKSNQKASVFYYDEVKKSWVEVGGKVNGNKITVDINHFTKFTVLAVDNSVDIPTDETSPDMKPTINLSDITGHWAEANIKQAVSNGIVKGYLDGTFQPNHTVTRAEFAVMLMNVLKPQGKGADLTFTDTVKIGAWAQTAIAQAVQAGIITGYEDGGFRPNAEITRAEMAVILAKALGKSTEVKPTTGFADDKDIPAWAKGSVDFVKHSGLVQGKGNNEFAPQDSATRAEAVTVLLKLLAQLNN